MAEQILEDIHNTAQAVLEGNEDVLWKSFYSIKTDLEFDPDTPSQEKDIISFLNANLSAALRNRRLTPVSTSLTR